MKLKGKISISKVYVCGKIAQDSYISIEIEDELSSVRVIQANLSLKDFANAITGLSNLPCEFELGGIENIGKQLEVKTEEVVISESAFYDQAIREGVRKYEVDGWIGRDKDAKNHHNWVRNCSRGAIYKISYHRWVKVGEKNEPGVS